MKHSLKWQTCVIVVIAVNFVLFQNFTGCSPEVQFTGGESTKNLASGGGNGEPTDGKIYYRWVDGYRCRGKKVLLGEVHIQANKTSAKVLDSESCELVSETVSTAQLFNGQMDHDVIGYGSGIYIRSDLPVDPIKGVPSVSYEAWCRGTNDKNVEILIEKNATSNSLTFKATLDNNTKLGPFPVARTLNGKVVEYSIDDFKLQVDRTASLSAIEVSGNVRYNAGSAVKTITDLKCRTGAVLDVYNHFAPVRQFDFFGPTLPTGFTLTRASSGSYYDGTGILRTAPANTPRFNFDFEIGKLKGLLVEKASTNLLINSQRLDQWIVNGMTTTANTAQTMAPSGLAEAELFRNTNANTNHQIMSRISLRPETFYSFSAFIKPAASQAQRLVRLQILEEANMSNDIWASFDLSAGTVDYIPTFAGPNTRQITAGVERHPQGWFRVWVSGVPPMTSTTTPSMMQVFIESLDSSSSQGIYADPNLSGFYMWGAQLEESEFMTSYIATGATQVARAADFLNSNDVAWWDPGASEGSIMVDKNVPKLAVNQRSSVVHSYFSMLSGMNEVWSLFFDRSASQFASAISSSRASSVQVTVPGLASLSAKDVNLRSVASFNSDSVSIFVNGQGANAINAAGAPSVPNRVVLSADTLGGRVEHVQFLRYWPFRLETSIQQQLSNEVVP